MENQLATVQFSTEEIDTIKKTIAPAGITDPELKMFLYQCKRTGLDPFSRQIYALKMGGKVSIQSSIDGFRLIAERSGKYQGQTIPLYLNDKGSWVEVWTEPLYPIACKVGVLRSDFKEPLYAIAKWDSYCPKYNGQVGTMWAKMPEVMLAKVAEALALRKAFPNDLSGIYSQEEMAQAKDTEYDTTPIHKNAVPVITYDVEETSIKAIRNSMPPEGSMAEIAYDREMDEEIAQTTQTPPKPLKTAPSASKTPSTKLQPPKSIANSREAMKKEIFDLINSTVLAPLTGKEEYTEYVMSQTGLDLADPAMYSAILERLQANKTFQEL